MKKIKFIVPMATIATAGAILPLAFITSCGPKIDYTEAEVVGKKDQEGKNSFQTYTAKLSEFQKMVK